MLNHIFSILYTNHTNISIKVHKIFDITEEHVDSNHSSGQAEVISRKIARNEETN